MTTETLIPASNFEVRKLAGVKVYFSGGCVEMSGWGIFDKAANGYVHMNDFIEVDGVGKIAIPYSLRQKKTAQAACADGLYEGYSVLKLASV